MKNRPSLAGTLLGLLFLFGLFLPHSARAWGLEGHRLTGHMAEALLAPRARLQVQRLLEGGTLAQAATVMDEERAELAGRLPHAAAWHFDNQPLCKAASYRRYCAGQHCATAQIARFEAVLANARAPLAERRQALQFVVHMLADLHQPLHAASNADAGGNLVKVLVRARERRLHAVWDTDVVKSLARGQPEALAARNLLARHEARLATWRQPATPRQVQAESHRLAREVAYGRLPGFACGQPLHDDAIELTDAYLEQAREVAGVRLAMAAVRIAETLNRALGSAEKYRP